MTKKKTLKKQKVSRKNTPALKKFEPAKYIKKMTKNDLLEVLVQSLADGDPESFKEILWSYLEVHNKADIARKMKISRSTLYHIVSEEGNPTLDVLAKLIGTIAA